MQSTGEIIGKGRPKYLRNTSSPGHFVHHKFRIILSGTESDDLRLASARTSVFLISFFANSPPVLIRLCADFH